ncbi:hypothetical protein JC525_08880 [Alteromonas sp. IB21]|uniref:hypothetical protein n=1 Tax=Alteromonas sp. IB21 TaxID=2779369 RepID=UPI0018E83444|nr:hypothetical protein [Alteromonas sp. IB21]MBJ2129049.1 hypothetical protein [Alteromonas sp. IB21]
MSKSALFAGLGQGLMAAGQNIGEAYRMKAIEELRQENLQQNWAREDKIRELDIAREDKLRTEKYAREDANKVTSTLIEKRDDGSKFKIGKNAAGEQVTSEQMEVKPKVVQTRIKTTETGEKFIESYDQNGNLVSSEQKDTSQNQKQTSTHQDLVNMGKVPGTPEYQEAYEVLSGLAPNAAEKERLSKMAAQKAQDETNDQTLAMLMGDKNGDGTLSRSAPIDGAAGWFDDTIWTPIQSLWNGDGYIDNKTLTRVASKLKSEALAAASGNPSDKDLEMYAGSIPTPDDSEEVWKEWYRNEYLPRRQKLVSHNSSLGATQTQGTQDDSSPRIGRFKVVGVN